MSLNFYQRAEANVAELKQRFPEQFEHASGLLRWPDGWHSIVEGVCSRLAATGPIPKWLEIREEIRSLRMAFRGLPPRRIKLRGPDDPRGDEVLGGPSSIPEVFRLTVRAREDSHVTCMKCGAPGVGRLAAGWLPLCDADLRRFGESET